MAKSKPADKKAVKADALKNGGGKVTKPAEAPKANAKSIAKAAASKLDGGKDKKSKKPVKAPEPESDSSEEDSEDEEMDDSSSASSESEDDSEDSASDSDSASDVESAPKTNGVNGVAKKANGVAAKKPQDSDDSSSEEDSEDDSDAEPAAAAAAKDDDDDSSDEEEDSDDSEDDSEVDTKTKSKAPATNGVNGHKAADASEEEEDSDDSDSSEDDEEEEAAPQQKKRKAEAEAESTPKKSKTDNDSRPKNLFVGNLSWNVDEAMLAEEFGGFGEITGCRVVTDRNSGRSKGFGYVEFSDADAAAAAHDSKKGALLDGRELNVDFSTPRPEKPAGDRPSWQDRAKERGDQVGKPADTLFLGNLPFNTSNEEIHEAFSEYGTVTRVSLPTDRESGAPKGFGYVSFTSIDEAKAAYEALQGQDYNGRPIRMDYAQPRADNGGGGGGFGGRGGGRGGGFQRGGGRGGRGGDRGRGRGGSRGGRPPSTNRGGFGDFSGQKVTF